MGIKGPFSYQTYLLHMLEPQSWADEIVLTVMSIMFHIMITLVNAHNLKQVKIRHKLDLKKADLTFLYAGSRHYSAIGTYMGVIDTGVKVIGGGVRVIKNGVIGY